MSTMVKFDRPGILERATDSTAFAVLFALASIMLAPSALVGFFVVPVLFSPAGRASSEVWSWLILSAGGVVGYLGLFRARRPATSSADYRATLVCLAIGILAGIAVVGRLVDSTLLGDVYTAAAVVVPAIPVVAAVGRIARLRRLHAATEGRVPDSLPLVFLSIALAEAACAIAIGVRLALGG